MFRDIRFKYRVLNSRISGNGIKQYKILNMQTGEVFENRALFFFQEGDDAFVNVRVGEKYNFNILKKDKVV